MNSTQQGATHYVDNVHFQKLLTDRHTQNEENGEPLPLSNEIGGIIIQIAENLSYRRNFINYWFREEMVGDAIENCLRYVDRYDCINYSNPFAYFTQMCFYAFVRRITKEEKQTDTREAIYNSMAADLGIQPNSEIQSMIIDDLYRD